MVPLHDGGAMKFSQRGCTPAEKKEKDGGIPLHTGYTHTCTHFSFTHIMFWPTLSGRGCWFLCGRYRGRKQQPPWQRHLDQSSTSSASLSVRQKAQIINYYTQVLGWVVWIVTNYTKAWPVQNVIKFLEHLNPETAEYWAPSILMLSRHYKHLMYLCCSNSHLDLWWNKTCCELI